MESRGDAVKVCVVLRLKPVYKHQTRNIKSTELWGSGLG